MQKFIFKSLFTVIAVMSLLLVQSCSKKEPEPDRNKFLGTYLGTDTCSPGEQYSMTISTSVDSPSTVILTIDGIIIKGTVNSSNITIPSQQLASQGNSFTISGSSSLNGNSFSMTYTISIAGNARTCTYTGNRQ